MRILIVEDDVPTARALGQGLSEEGYDVVTAADGRRGLELGLDPAVALIVLDVLLPHLDGLQVAATLRARGIVTPILMLTGQDSVEDVVRGLDAGADDYLAKPFAFDELLARVRAATRRAPSAATAMLVVGTLRLDRLKRTAFRDATSIALSPRELALLEHFMQWPDVTLTREALLLAVWHMDFDPQTNVVDAHVSNLRRKLEAGGHARQLFTVRSAGYVLRSRS